MYQLRDNKIAQELNAVNRNPKENQMDRPAQLAASANAGVTLQASANSIDANYPPRLVDRAMSRIERDLVFAPELSHTGVFVDSVELGDLNENDGYM